MIDDDDTGPAGPSWAWDFVQPMGERKNVSAVLIEQRAAADDAEAQPGTTLFVASTEDPDRYMDVVKQDWNLRNFRRNPVILDNHNPMRVVGKAIEAKVPRVGDDAGKLMIRVAWHSDASDPGIRTVGEQHLNGFRSAGSVGFRHGKKTSRDKLPPDHPAFQQAQVIEVDSWFGSYELEMAGWYYEKNELFEFSSATIPANPEALQRSLLIELGHLAPDDVEGRARAVGQTVQRATAADLLTLARQLQPEERQAFASLFWPDQLELMRSDPTYRRIHRALGEAGPPPAAIPSFEALVLRHLES